MITEQLINQIKLLPEELQIQVLDYIEFLLIKYNCLNSMQPELTIETKNLLDEYLLHHENNKGKAVTFEEFNSEINKEFGYAI